MHNAYVRTNYHTTVPSASSVSTLVIRQPQMPKPYNGSTSWKSFRDYFTRICRINNWTTPSEQLQSLSLALEGPACEVLKDVDETSPIAVDDIWKLLARRFGQTNEPRDAQRRFHTRRQLDNETIPEFESALRSLYREAWPNATP